MRANNRREVPDDLQRARSRFQAWREHRKAGGRLPQELWALAVRLVKIHGVSRTASALGVDYYSLKKRVAASEASSSGPAFIELPAPVLGGKQCRFELDNGSGATLRVQLMGYDTADVEALARVFGNAK